MLFYNIFNKDNSKLIELGISKNYYGFKFLNVT